MTSMTGSSGLSREEVPLAQGVVSYDKNKAVMYSCLLDAEGAFDALPFPVLFRKAYGILPRLC